MDASVQTSVLVGGTQNPVPAQPYISETAAEHSTYVWELHQKTLPAPLIPSPDVLNPAVEPDLDASVSILDLMTKVGSGSFIRGQAVNKPSEWTLDLKKCQSEKGYDIYLVLTCTNSFLPESLPIWTKFAVEIIDSDGIPILPTKSVFDTELRYFTIGANYEMKIGSKSELQSSLEQYAEDGIYRIRLHLIIYKDLQKPLANQDENEDYKPAAKRSRLEAGVLPSFSMGLLGTLENLWSTRETAGDITICFSSTETTKAHKFILSARSKVFARMFDSLMDTKENESSVLKIEDISHETMLYFLEYLYLGHVSRFDWTNIDHISVLIYAADKYWIIPLMITCFQNLIKLMDLNNFAQIAKITFTYDCEKEFKDEVRHFYESHLITLNGIQSFQAFALEHFDEFHKLFFYKLV